MGQHCTAPAIKESPHSFKRKMAFWHPCHTLACWALGAHFGRGQQQMPHSFRPTHPLGPKSHWAGMPAAQRRQKTTKMPVVTKNSQPQGPTKWERSVGISNQLQKPTRGTCGHALARFWAPGPMQQVRGLAWWAPPGLMHFFGLGGISRKFSSFTSSFLGHFCDI